MINSKGTVVVGGFLGLLPIGGVVWDYIQYVIGFQWMGYDVYYLEDTKIYPVFGRVWNDSTDTVNRLREIMKYFGLEDRYIYRDELTQQFFGRSKREYLEICKAADIFINISCSNVIREEYSHIPVRILLDTDPMFTQIQINSNQSFTTDNGNLKELAQWHTHHFTFGENIFGKDCLIPRGEFSWVSTRQPICMDFWKYKELDLSKSSFTTLMNWKVGKKLKFAGQDWGQKDVTFPLILNLPNLLPHISFKLAVSQTGGGVKGGQFYKLLENGWNLISPEEASGDHLLYQEFIYSSEGEISVAKETYVKAKTGWFSCRSACYLASGRPVVAQDTGWSEFYPTGMGLFSFTDEHEAEHAIRKISENWKAHSLGARELAKSYFDHNIVLGKLIDSL
ncbi:hypothetical protein SYJ56_22990 [Algoriphagus sp. D3-2-R+10]|uniref:glycosyltransferase n=1 Tax=Algoriphagus aurantiacus TaxID=3103948 RepID=UPI002B3EFCBB|nr:hypothetical protein [Algoriphagus sp. D3-2-R+10]MEB2778195.1 hypothetical protein [Algoriphagus sp. D3-2-R+10]